MPTRTRNSISKAIKKISSPSNSKHHQKRITAKRKTRERNIHRTTDACTTFTDTLYSVKLLPKPVIEIKVLQGSDALFKTEQQVIQCCKDLFESCRLEIGGAAFSSNRPIFVLSEIIERIVAQFPEYDCYVEYDDELKKWQFAICEYYNFDYLYFLPFDLLMEAAGTNKLMQQYVYVALKHIANFGIDVCFNSQEEEIHVEILDENIINAEAELVAGDDVTRDEIAINIEQLQNEKAFFVAGEFYEKGLIYKKTKAQWNLKRCKPTSDTQEQLLNWFKEVQKVAEVPFSMNSKNLGNIYLDERDGDGCLEACRVIRVVYSEDGIAGHITSEINDLANNFGIEQLVWKNILSPTVKAPTIPQQFYDILNIMSYPNTKYNEN